MAFRYAWFGSRPRVRRWLLALTFVIVGWLLASVAAAYRLTHRQRPPFAEPSPRVAWGPIESHRIATSDGEEVGAWLVDRRDQAPSVLVLHGNNGSRKNSLGRAEMLASQGFAVLMISLRAHGDSTGGFHDIGYSARRDVLAAVHFLEERRAGRPIIVIGTSMGAAAAVFAARELGHRVQGYVLESPYQDLKVAVWNRTDVYLPPVLSQVAYAGLRSVGPLFIPRFEQISPLKAMAGIPNDVPVLIMAGTADRLARPEEALRSVSRSREPRQAGSDHGRRPWGPVPGRADLYTRKVLEFCRELARGADCFVRSGAGSATVSRHTDHRGGLRCPR